MQRLDIQQFLKQMPALAEELAQVDALQALWQAVAPANLAQHSFASKLNAGTLTVITDSGGVASKLKLISPALLKNLHHAGCVVSMIRIKVQVTPPPTIVPAHHSFEAMKKRQLLHVLQTTR
ncbi:MAG: DUF721 domain-containing protein [Methylophilaceae bacterium]|nr:DUF721 domain-containing protein [Methylophilaceae bacterium]